MGVDIGRYGVWASVGRATPSFALSAEELGYSTFWVGSSPPGDLHDIEQILEATKHIAVATGIVNMWRDDAATVGESYLRIAQKHSDRFLLGVGVGHPESSAEYVKPIDKVNDYLDQLEHAGVPSEAVVLAALGPMALQIAAKRTAGAHRAITTPRHTAMARKVMDSGPLLAPEQMVVLSGNTEAARSLIRANTRRYLGLTNYRRSFLREGWSKNDLGNGGSDELIDLLGLHGTADEVFAGLSDHIDAGADHVCVQALGDDPTDQLATLARVLL